MKPDQRRLKGLRRLRMCADHTHICKLIRHLIALDAFFYLQRTRLTTLHSPSLRLLAVTPTPPPPIAATIPTTLNHRPYCGRSDIRTRGRNPHHPHRRCVIQSIHRGPGCIMDTLPNFFCWSQSVFKKKQKKNCIVRGTNTHSHTRAHKKTSAFFF